MFQNHNFAKILYRQSFVLYGTLHTLVCPIMEYAASVWDPYQLNDIQALEKVQRRAACWVMKGYSRYSRVSAILHYTLNWPPLQVRPKLYTTYQHYLFHLTSYLHKDLPDTTTHFSTSSPVQKLALFLTKNN